MSKLFHFLRDDSGATAIEYALISGAVAIAILAFLPTIRNSMASKFSQLGSGLSAT